MIGFLVLLAGFILKKPQIKNTALGIFIFSGLTTITAFLTGEGAEEIVENLPGISETLIHKHEEICRAFSDCDVDFGRGIADNFVFGI